MTQDEIVEAVLEWVVATVPDVEGNTYSHMPTEREKALPDVCCDITSTEVMRNDPDFPLLGLQQVVADVSRVGLSFMVDAGMTEATALAATQLLRSFIDSLKAGLLADHTLGGRVPFASPFLLVDSEPRFIEWGSGTRGREIVVLFSVAEPLQYED